MQMHIKFYIAIYVAKFIILLQDVKDLILVMYASTVVLEEIK